MLSTANLLSLLNCVVCSESGVHCRIMLSVVNKLFAAKLCCPQRIRFWLLNLCCSQRIRFSLPNLCCSQRIRCFLSNNVFRSESAFRCRIVLSATNQVFAVELCISQRIRCSLPNYVVRSESGVRCRIMFSVANQVFAAEFVLSAANQLFAIELCCP